LIAFNLGIQQNRNVEEVRAIAAKCTAKSYVKKVLVVETPEQAKAREERKEPPPVAAPVSSADDEENLQKLMTELKALIVNIKKDELQAAEFEKDDETNFHIDYIHATA
jgi:ubiquitin-activating enzyme E1